MEGREVGNAMDEPQEQEADSHAKRPRVDLAASPNLHLELSPSPPRLPPPVIPPPPASPTDAIQDIANNNYTGKNGNGSVSDVDSGAGSIINGPNRQVQ